MAMLEVRKSSNSAKHGILIHGITHSKGLPEMSEQSGTPSFPESLMIRDTQLHDDIGVGGQRIFTTAGQGYQKIKYIRADIAEREAADLREQLAEARREFEQFKIDGGKAIQFNKERAESAERRAAELTDTILSMLSEIGWFVSRRKNLAEDSGNGRSWADVLNDDLDIGRRALASESGGKEG